MSNLLSLITFIPLVAAVILALLARGDGEASQRNVKYLALAATGFTFLASLMLLSGFEPNDTGFQFVEERSWLLGMQYKMGVDGISLLFVLLTLMPATVIFAWAVDPGVQEFVRSMPFVLQCLACAVIADIVQYTVHRLFHRLRWLWPFHAVHHSSRNMDWLAGSRLHIVDVIVTRWQNLTGENAILSGTDRSFGDLETERLGNTAAQSQKGAS